MASLVASVGGSLVSGLLSRKSGSNSQPKAAPFTPSNIYTPSGSATWNKGVGSATLSPEISGLRSDYINNANNYQGAISQYFAPNKSNFYKQNPNYQPKSYADYSKELTPQFTTTTQNNNQSNLPYIYPYQGFGGAAISNNRSGTTSSSVNQSGLDSAIHDAMQRDQQNNTSFDQAGYDSAVAGYQDPSEVYYNKLRALSKPSEDQARADNESRLFSQGLMGQSNGQGYNPGIKSFEDSAHQADLQREITAMNYAPDMLTKYQNLQNSALTGVQSFDQNPLDQLKLGANIGLGTGSNSIQNANVQNQISNSAGNFWGAAAGNIGSAVERGVNGLFSSNQNNPGSTTSNFQSPFGVTNKYYSG